MDQYIGKLLDNRYEILELIGVGGMARVYKARCHRLNRLVAVKILRDDLAQDAELRRRFHDESHAVAMLSHPNIVAVYDVSRSSDIEYIVMELIDGITLKQYMQKKGNKLNWREALHFITQIVKALGHAHSRGIIHRDIKPHNIMVLRDGSVKVADFGIARVTSGGHSTLTQEALGSVHYISPEQARGSHIDERSDLYSAGVVLYEMITGRLPFEGDTPVSVAIQHINSIPLSPREIDPTIPEALEAITMKAMAPDPDNRYPSADAMLADLEEFRKNPNINFDFSASEFHPEEEDVDRTQIHTVPPRTSAGRREMPASKPERQDRRARRIEEEEDDEEDERRGPNWPVIGAVAAILVFVAALVFIMFSTVFSGSFQPGNTQRVPTVTGLLYSEASQDTSLLGDFTLEIVQEKESDKPAGTILSQDPTANSAVTADTGTVIQVVVSTGQANEVRMPDVTGQDYLSANTQLKNLASENGLNLKIDFTTKTEYNDEVEKDYVISTIPAEGEALADGDTVYLVVSLGKDTQPVDMPGLLGKTEDMARKMLDSVGLSVGGVQHEYSDDYPKGQVCFQSVNEGTKVEQGTAINLIISDGPDPNSQPVPTEVTKDVMFALPDVGAVVNVEVYDSQGNKVHSGSYDTNLQSGFELELKGTGTQVYSVYVEGHKMYDQTVDFDS
ncbi:Stk1 family PASTA domain-containing Ser/Thr kinase [Pseudoflavonifractor phocaeensis]|uniref:Stk1 family PASTA domain-containing Ser/Thr kinase n=1 Tax=Pseudoflavonifractor phocaeensis TaxID=1870988 RepID=UPI0025A3D733|nr:Stk1 family PASTA domain-containing Ser/Thr kinase [Pseudoflavonifractor phocaeensis]MDM8237868.1 Stk1 family PASTA domain-containing Ser/Thr kinase [Pseudoflavonifractor phocaeensis]